MTPNKSALVIDDSPSMREYIQAILKDELDFTKIHLACCADEGIDILEADKGHEIRWVITDWEMPGKSCSEVFKYVADKYKPSEINIILITGKNSHDAMVLSNHVHADDFISKPFDAETFVKKVHRLLGLNERRRIKRVTPCIPCEIDIGFDNYGRYGASLVNISEIGCLVKMENPDERYAHIYDIGSITLTYHGGIQLVLDGQIVRVERDTASAANSPGILVALEFCEQDPSSQAILTSFINQCRLVLETGNKLQS